MFICKSNYIVCSINMGDSSRLLKLQKRVEVYTYNYAIVAGEIAETILSEYRANIEYSQSERLSR